MKLATKMDRVIESLYTLPNLKDITDITKLEDVITDFIDELVEASFDNIVFSKQYSKYNKEQIEELTKSEVNNRDFWFGYAYGLLTYALAESEFFCPLEESQLQEFEVSQFKLPDLEMLDDINFKKEIEEFQNKLTISYYQEDDYDLLYNYFNINYLCDLYNSSNDKKSYYLGFLAGTLVINDIILRDDIAETFTEDYDILTKKMN